MFPGLRSFVARVEIRGMDEWELLASRPSWVVLYVDDHEANRRLVERILARRPAVELLTFEEGATGLGAVFELHPDLVLLDLNLPDTDGCEVLTAIRNLPTSADIPVVIISGDATEAQAKRCLDAGADAYLTKPFDIDELLEVVDRFLIRRAS
jgi:CheY-like chemotaxis protein